MRPKLITMFFYYVETLLDRASVRQDQPNRRFGIGEILIGLAQHRMK